MEIRNIAIIAHVDHGKTTLTDAIMRQTGQFKEGMSMDTNTLEKERGITIYSKNTATFYKDTKINIIDTPGHADFGSEVERVLRSIDSVVLVVDAQEGPMPQTRFVLKKSLELGLEPILVVNKIDKTAADPKRTIDDVLGLFMELGANEKQMNFPIIYAIGREGLAVKDIEDEKKDVSPLLDVILENVPPAKGDKNASFKAQPFNLDYDNFMGRLAVVRIYEGKIKSGDSVFVKNENESRPGKITKIFSFKGLAREEVKEAEAGDIVLVAGLPDIFIGETICQDAAQEILPSIKIDDPTITLDFMPNNSPFSGRCGKFVTSRQIRERFKKELEVNVGLKIDFSESDRFKVFGRGELHIAILLENMRREGYELQVSQPKVIIKEENGQMVEPFEEMTIDAPPQYQGIIIERLGKRKAVLLDIKQDRDVLRMIFEGPTRGILGYRGQFIVDTRGEGILASRVIGFRPHVGEIEKRATGSMISMMSGKALGFALWNLQERGELYIGPGTEVYEGMVVGNTSKGEEMSVNPTKGKHLTNLRASGSDENIMLAPFKKLTIEIALEIMAEDEFLEVTPDDVRLRKQYLSKTDRAKVKRGSFKAGETLPRA